MHINYIEIVIAASLYEAFTQTIVSFLLLNIIIYTHGSSKICKCCNKPTI